MSLDTRTFSVTSSDPAANPRAVAWLQSVRRGFVGADYPDRLLGVALEDAVADGWRMRAVHDTAAPAYAQDAPVATFVTYDKTMNVGGAEPIPITCITDVVVHATHRRRGLLRAMMTEELRLSRERGHPLAALTVTEGTIYGRFGFGPTTFVHQVEVDTAHHFGLRVEPGGRVDAVDQETAARLAGELFDRLHSRSFGSVAQMASAPRWAAGLVDHESGEPDRRVRNAVHSDDRGDVDGWIAYAPAKEGREKLEVQELVALTDEAYLALWQFVGSIDLSRRVAWSNAPLDDPLPWALVDPRGHRVTGRRDNVWTRVLDPVALLAARGYAEVSGRIVLGVSDPLGHAAGCWELTVEQGSPTASRTAREPDLTCAVEDLGPLVLGGAAPAALAAAGRVRGTTAALAGAHSLFGALGRPWTSTHF